MQTGERQMSVLDVPPSEPVVTTEAVHELIERPMNLGALAVDGPEKLLGKAAEVATALKKVIVDKKLYVKIKDKNYVYAEGWTTLGAMLGVGVKERQTVEGETEGEFIAEVEAIRLADGVVIGSASASCGPDEREWGSRTRQARRSMAQTRAAGKCMRLLFSWVMNLAGYAVTPWEEIAGELVPDLHDNPDADANAPKSQPRGDRVQLETIKALGARWLAVCKKRGEMTGEADWLAFCRKVCGMGQDYNFLKPANWTSAHVQRVTAELQRLEATA